MKRKIIKIDQDKCTGCGDCIPNCPEGAIQMIDGKARLVSDLACDGLGACLGHCPVGAIEIEEREAAPYDERKVMETILPQGANTLKAHLAHLRDHQQFEYLQIAMAVLQEKGIPNPMHAAGHGPGHGHGGGGCPGARAMAFAKPAAAPAAGGDESGKRPSQLTHWPLQLHLIGPQAPHYQGADLLLAADCTAFALGDFHKDFLKGKALAIACPKLDDGQEVYVEKLKALMDDAKINTLTVMIMQVPCCGGLLRLAQTAAAQAQRKVPIECVVVGLQGGILKEEWVRA
jgi:NAD-dependent dihydropyrimidine dehydrogenase PreA subunit